MTITWQPIPDIQFTKGTAASFGIEQFVTSDLPVTIRLSVGSPPPGVTFDGKQFLYDGIGTGSASGLVLTADDAVSPAVTITTVETVTVNGMVMGPRTAIAFGASPAIVQNTTANRLLVAITGGTVSNIEFSRDGITFDGVGIGGQFILNPSDQLRVTYSVAPSGACYPI